MTIDAAYSWRLEDELGSMAPGKSATFTVLGEDRSEVDLTRLRDIPVIGVGIRGALVPRPRTPSS